MGFMNFFKPKDSTRTAGPRAEGNLLATLHSQDEDKAALAAISLGKQRCSEARDELVGMLNPGPTSDRFFAVGRAAIYALGSISCGETADAVVGTTLETSTSQGKLSLWFARQAGASAVPTLARVIESPGATRAIEFGRDPRESRNFGDWARKRAAGMLGATGDASATAVLLNAGANRQVGDSVFIEALLSLGETALPGVRDCLSSAEVNESARVRAMAVLAERADPVDEALFSASWDAHSLSVKVPALVGSAKLGDEGAVRKLAQLATEVDKSERDFVVKALGRTGSTLAATALIEEFESNRAFFGGGTSYSAYWALEHVDSPEAASYLLGMVEQKGIDWSGAYAALGNQYRHDKRIVNFLSQAVVSGSGDRHKAAVALARMDDAAAHEALIGLFSAAPFDPSLTKAVTLAGLRQCLPQIRRAVGDSGEKLKGAKANDFSQWRPIEHVHAIAIDSLGYLRDAESVPLLLEQYDRVRGDGKSGPLSAGNIIKALYHIGVPSREDKYLEMLRDGYASIDSGALCELIVRTSDEEGRAALGTQISDMTDPEVHIAADGSWDAALFGPLPLDHWATVLTA